MTIRKAMRKRSTHRLPSERAPFAERRFGCGMRKVAFEPESRKRKVYLCKLSRFIPVIG